MIKGDTIRDRKRLVAKLAADHLGSLGYHAEVSLNQTNSKGHKDHVLIDSELGLIHVIATNSLEPNEIIPIGRYDDKEQRFLADKSYVVFGWNSRDKRTFLFFVPVEHLKGQSRLSKNQIKSIKDASLSAVLKL